MIHLRFALALTPLLLITSACDKHAHGLRAGHLAEVGAPELVVSTNESVPLLSVGNEAGDKSCLELTQLTAKIDGVAQTLVFAGGRSDGATKGSLGPTPGADSCASARFTIARTTDRDHATNVIEVTDGTATLRAEIPNVTTEAVWSTPPPNEVHAGSTFHVSIFPPPVKGTGKYDAENLAVVSFHDPKKPDADIKLAARATPDGFDIDVPATVAGGPYTLYFASSETVVPAVSCTATACRSAGEFVLRAPVNVAK